LPRERVLYHQRTRWQHHTDRKFETDSAIQSERDQRIGRAWGELSSCWCSSPCAAPPWRPPRDMDLELKLRRHSARLVSAGVHRTTRTRPAPFVSRGGRQERARGRSPSALRQAPALRRGRSRRIAALGLVCWRRIGGRGCLWAPAHGVPVDAGNRMGRGQRTSGGPACVRRAAWQAAPIAALRDACTGVPWLLHWLGFPGGVRAYPLCELSFPWW